MLAPLAYYLHDFNPIIFEFFFIKPRWYGFSYLLGFVCGYFLVRKLARDGMLRLPIEKIPDLALAVCIWGVLVGGRLGFCLFYDLPQSLENHVTPLLWSFTNSFPYWGVLRVNEGGMAAHGGILFTILTLILFARRNKTSIVNVGDAACMVVPLGLLFGRLANFINGELYGRVTTVPWAVQFPSEIYAPTNKINTINPQLLEEAHFKVAQAAASSGVNLGELTNYQLAQLVRRSDEIGTAARIALRDILPARHPSQLYEAALEGLLLFLIVWTVGRLWKKDGMASGAFLTFYPIMRIIGEQFRVGDTSVNLLGLQASAGELYSLLMFIPAIIFWAYWIKKNRRVPWVPQLPKTECPATAVK